MPRAVLISISLHLLALWSVWIGFPVAVIHENTAYYFTQLSMSAKQERASFERPLPSSVKISPLLRQWELNRSVRKPRGE